MDHLLTRTLAIILKYSVFLLLTSVKSASLKENDRSLHMYQYFPESERIELKETARKMFYFGYDNYMKYAFPKDELNPIYCTGRGPDYENP